MILALVVWTQVFTFPARDIRFIQGSWALGNVVLEHRADTVFRVEIHKPDTLPDHVVLHQDTVPYSVEVRGDTLVLLLHTDQATGIGSAILEILRGTLRWILHGEKPSEPWKQNIQVVITGPARPFDLRVSLGDLHVRTPASGTVAVEVGNLVLEASDTARLEASVDAGDAQIQGGRTLTLEVNVGDVTVEDITRAVVTVNVGDLTAHRVDTLSMEVNVGNVQVEEAQFVEGEVNIGDLDIRYRGARPEVRVETDLGSIHYREVKP